ncbi:MAG TPA: DUF1840 domain-containing protein [Pseudorhodoferax sp.]|jgi:cyclopropane-fatty-acyl-phospholipid synthase|nr:DUF1840 domain-containing protein [Pseudorhodoferax sp.]
MLFKFKSKATGDLIMLEPNGRRVLQLIGKEPGPTGIIAPAQMPGAVAALEKAIAEEEAAQKAAEDEAHAKGEQPRTKPEVVSLRQRAVPFIEMLRRAEAAGQDVVWGV